VILDTVGMFDAVAAFPEQIQVAAAAAHGALDSLQLPDHDDVANVVVLGMGTSGQAGSLALEVAGPLMAIPVIAHRGYGVPNFVDSSTLVMAASYSGNTEEVLEGAANALEDGASVLCLSTGGELRDFAAANGLPHVSVTPEAPVGRAALGSLAIPMLIALEKIGFFPGGDSWITEAVEQTSRRRDSLITEDNEARRLARRLGRAFPIIYGGNGIGSLAAERWKTQFNENAKVAAFTNRVPELTHNEVCGWGQDGDVTRQIFQLFMLRHDFEHPQVMRRLDVLDDILDEVVGAIHRIDAKGEGPLAQLLDLMLVGDFVSLHSAVEQGVDPGPVPTIAEIETRVSGR
jgi:glucose/mannose-6-phosphate isomerase